jgi:hypothetical protein
VLGGEICQDAELCGAGHAARSALIRCTVPVPTLNRAAILRMPARPPVGHCGSPLRCRLLGAPQRCGRNGRPVVSDMSWRDILLMLILAVLLAAACAFGFWAATLLASP